jgi:hypothetical protein
VLNKKSQAQKGTDSVWFHLCEVLEKTQRLIYKKETSGCMGSGQGVDWLIKDTRKFWDQWKVL